MSQSDAVRQEGSGPSSIKPPCEEPGGPLTPAQTLFARIVGELLAAHWGRQRGHQPGQEAQPSNCSAGNGGGPNDCRRQCPLKDRLKPNRDARGDEALRDSAD
jgi:hypothetical protein